MRVVFGVLSLLVVVAVIGILAKKQLGGISPGAAQQAPVEGGMAAPSGPPKQQVQQYKQAVEGAMQQQPRQTPDEPK